MTCKQLLLLLSTPEHSNKVWNQVGYLGILKEKTHRKKKTNSKKLITCFKCLFWGVLCSGFVWFGLVFLIQVDLNLKSENQEREIWREDRTVYFPSCWSLWYVVFWLKASVISVMNFEKFHWNVTETPLLALNSIWELRCLCLKNREKLHTQSKDF